MRDDSRNAALDELFDRAKVLAPGDREQFFREHCDEEQGRELRSLFDVYTGTETMAQLAAIRELRATIDLLPRQIGPYELVGLLGEGGMGSVYLARQTGPIQREVAFKLMRAPTATYRDWFVRERQTLARMNHGNIARVYEAGETDEAEPFLAMEYVTGPNLLDYCDQNRLSIVARCRLFVQVCRGVQHAHLKQVLHRDLKPSNILIAIEDGVPIPKIIDFGISFDESRDPAAAGSGRGSRRLPGTRGYMSPEQAGFGPGDVDVDARTDVFSLGVVLAELLLGEIAFDAGSRDFPLGITSEADQAPAPASARLRAHLPLAARIAEERSSTIRGLERTLRSDYDWVLRRSLAIDREQRYQTPLELAEDLDRVARHEPLRAGPRTWRYRARKLLRRYFVQVAALSILMAALLVVLVGISHAARVARSEAAHNRDLNLFWTEMLTSVDPEFGGPSVLLATVVDRVARDFDVRFPDRPRLAGETGTTLGRIFHGLGRPRLAVTWLERGIALLDEHGAEPAVLSEARRALASCQSDLGAYELARANYLEANAGAAHATIAERLAERHELALVLEEQGRLAEAEHAYRGLLDEELRELGASHRVTLTTMQSLAVVQTASGKAAEAEPALREVWRIRQAGLGVDDPETLSALNALGASLFHQNDFPAAESVFRAVVEQRRHRLGTRHQDTLTAMNNLAAVEGRLGDWSAAADSYRELVRLEREEFRPLHWRVLAARNNLGFALLQLGDGEAAVRELADVIELANREWPQGTARTCEWRTTYGIALVYAHRCEEALVQLDWAEATARREGMWDLLGKKIERAKADAAAGN